MDWSDLPTWYDRWRTDPCDYPDPCEDCDCEEEDGCECACHYDFDSFVEPD